MPEKHNSKGGDFITRWRRFISFTAATLPNRPARVAVSLALTAGGTALTMRVAFAPRAEVSQTFGRCASERCADQGGWGRPDVVGLRPQSKWRCSRRNSAATDR